MPLVTALNNLIASQHSAYIAGLIAAFTPCTLALIPIFLYRFDIWRLEKDERKSFKWRELGIVVVSFMISLGLSGLLFQQLLSSNFVNITRLILGNALVLIGILQLSGQLNLQFIANVTNPWALGFVSPWIVSLSPCVLPYFSALLGTAITGDTIFKFILFGIGLLTPAAAVALLGDRLLQHFRRSQKILARTERWGSWLIILTGAYLALQLVSISAQDILVTFTTLFGITLLIARRILHNATIANYTQVSVFISALIVTGILLASNAPQEVIFNQDLIAACVANEAECRLCVPVALISNIFIIWLAWLWIARNRTGKKVSFKIY